MSKARSNSLSAQIQQQLRRAKIEEIDRTRESGSGAELGEAKGGETTTAGTNRGTVATNDPDTTNGNKDKKPESYSWYRVEVTNRSITDETKREAIRAHLVWLASKLDDDALDHQLITLKYELMAGSDSGLADDVRTRAKAIQANKAEVEEEI